jgi:hypothetical protein
MITFQGFKPSGMQKIADSMGFQGNMQDFQKFLQDNPDRQSEMMRYQDMARKMVEGGYVNKMSKGGSTPKLKGIGSIVDVAAKRVTSPKLPKGAVVSPYGVPTDESQFIKRDAGSVGSTDPKATASTAYASTAEAAGKERPNYFSGFGSPPASSLSGFFPYFPPIEEDPDRVRETERMDAVKSADDVKAVTDATQAAQTDPNDPRAKVNAQAATKSLVGDLEAAQGTGIILNNPVQRDIQKGEIISGVADATKAAKFTEQVQAATAKPSEKATVQGQLAGLTANFDATNPPAWAAGAIRGVQSALLQRGLGASSMAGQALVQAAMESALPIAQADAQTQAQFEAQNLSNRQQRAMLAAQQRANFMGMEFDQAFQARVQNASRIADVANMNFNAEQQIALENSRIANTMELSNLSNRQAKVMAEAASLANLDTANLNNRQQAQVMNAQNFLQQEMANLSNKQQTELFRSQQRIQSLFTDQAAENASRQFNATSENQTKQFFANLDTQVSQFNASQKNAMAQFNAGEKNAVSKFNTEIQNQRDQFNAKNRLIIDQANAQWRRQIATADTEAINRANELNATALLNISNSSYNNLWQYYNDVMEMSWESTENERQRVVQMAIAQMQQDTSLKLGDMKNDYNSSVGFGNLVGTFLTAGKDSLLGSLLIG